MSQATTIKRTDPELLRHNAATATIAVAFEIEALAEDLRNAARIADRSRVRALQLGLQERITKAGEFIKIAFPREGS